MKDDSNKQKTINEQSELNLSFYFSFEESSSTESQNQKQLKAVPLYTVSGDEHSQGERSCALPSSVEFEYEEEPVERDSQSGLFRDEWDSCEAPHTDFVYVTGAEDCIDYCGVCGDIGCEFCTIGSDKYVPHELIQKLKNFGYDFSSYEESSIVNSVLFKNKENPLGLMQLWEDEGKDFIDVLSWVTCDCEHCNTIRNNIINKYRESKISESDLSASSLIEEIEVVENEPVPASDKLLALAKSQFKTSVREVIEKPSVFVCEALRLVLIPFVVAAMIVLFSRGASDITNDTITIHANEFFSVVTLIFGFLISIKAMKTFQPVVLFGLSAKELFKVLFLTKSVFFMTVIVKYLLPVFFFIITAQIGFYLEAPVTIMALVLVAALASVLFFFDDLNGFKLSEQIAVYKSRYNVQ